jgi:hypothetical protein
MYFENNDDNFYVIRKQAGANKKKKTQYSDNEPRIRLVGKNKTDKRMNARVQQCKNVDPQYALSEFNSLEIDSFEKRKR